MRSCKPTTDDGTAVAGEVASTKKRKVLQLDDDGALLVNTGVVTLNAAKDSYGALAVVNKTKTSVATFSGQTLNPRLYRIAIFPPPQPGFISSTATVGYNNVARVETTSGGSFTQAIIQDRTPLTYIPFEDLELHVDAKFDSVASFGGLTERVIWNGGTMDLGVGMSPTGTEWSAVFTHNAVVPVNLMTVTAAASGVETVTFTYTSSLLGPVVYTFNLTDASGDINFSTAEFAKELSEANFSGITLLILYPEHSNNELHIVDTFGQSILGLSVVSTGTFDATFSSVTDGVENVDDSVGVSNFNGDYVPDFTTWNAYRITISCAGSGVINYEAYDPTQDAYRCMHCINLAGSSTLLRQTVGLRPTLNASNFGFDYGAHGVEVTAWCSKIVGEPIRFQRLRFATQVTKVSIPSGAERNILALITRVNFNGTYVRGYFEPTNISVSVLGNAKSATIRFLKIFTGQGDSIGASTTTDYSNPSYVDEQYSIVQCEENSLTYNSITGVSPVYSSFLLAKDGTRNIEFFTDNVETFTSGEAFILTCEVSSGGAYEVSVSVSWLEFH
jgi:hypothetical protein